MKVSLSWLKSLVSFDMSADDLAQALTMVGLEVESIQDRYAYLSSVVVGKILSVTSHPQADRLKLCRVDVQERILDIVCGAPNAAAGVVAPVALPGTWLPGDHLIEKGVIRGVASEGMLCSEAELGLGVDASGILCLDAVQVPGTPLADALGLQDPVLEIDLTPNRPDCLSIIGVAREAAAISGASLAPSPPVVDDDKRDILERTSVTVEAPDLCPRYAARLVTGVTVAPSPFWLQDRLMSVGLRPVNNVVDVTNFVMMEQGQPLHAFDLNRLAEKRIRVRRARQGERFTTLDQKERTLSKDMLLICDGEKPVAVAGVMGGRNSEIHAASRDVLIESAYFLPTSIRRTAKQLGMNTEAGHRFERGIDPQGTLAALNRAARLIADIGGGQLVAGAIDEIADLPAPPTISLTVKETNRLLGTAFSAEQIGTYLESIAFVVTRRPPDRMAVQPPSFRVDVKRSVDLIEEVARLSGYNNIPTRFPLIPAESRRTDPSLAVRIHIKRVLIGTGFAESINYSFMDPKACDYLLLPGEDARRQAVRILNPLKEDQTVMRTSLLPGLIGSVQRNLARQEKHMRLFEIGKVFLEHRRRLLPREPEMLGAVWTGASVEPSWDRREVPCDFYDMKGAAEALFDALKINDVRFTAAAGADCPYAKPGAAADIIVRGDRLGFLGELHPDVRDAFELKQPAFFVELNLTDLYPLIPECVAARPIPRYPAVSRDVTMIVDESLEADALLQKMRSFGQELLEDLYIFDVFSGSPVPGGKKSVSFRIVYRSADETLSDDVVNRIHSDITLRVLEAFGATFPE